MKNYVTNDGEKFVAANSQNLIEQLKASSPWLPAKDTAEFMRAMAERVREQTGAEIDTASADGFVNGLLLAGLVKEQK